MKKADSDYYAARLSAEIAAAAAATDPHARRSHEKLAEQYRRLLEESRSREGPAQAAE